MIALSFLLSLSAYPLWIGVEGQTSGQLRLVARDGRSSSTLIAGRLEVYYSGQWGTVCDDNFGASAANIACRQLGFSSGYLDYTTVGTRFTAASSSTQIWLDQLSCSSFDTRLIDCAPFGTIGVDDCTHSEDIALFCLGNGALRLSSLFSSSSSGRLEIRYNGVWGTVCDNSFGQIDANVACRQLGYGSASNYGTVDSLGYSQGSGTIWLDDLACTSSDLMLSTCSHSGFGNENCVHSEDVAVSCSSVDVASSSGQLRLVARNGQTSSTLTAGRLEVYYNGQWGTVCDDQFGATAARIACNQLGFSRGYLHYTTVGTRFTAASSSTRTWLDQLSCSSLDTRLIDCAPFGTIGVEDCSHSEDIALFCLGNGAVRLSSSISSSSGRVDVYYNGVWGTVCNDLFGQTDADVACRQLGYSSAFNYGTVGSLGYSRGTGTIWLDNLACTSSDLMLTSCFHNGFGNHNCVHSEDVAVSCSASSTTGLTSAVIAGIVIAVVVPLCCIGICVTVVVIAVCTGACAGGASSSRNRRQNVTTTTVPAAAAATVVTSTGAKTDLGSSSAPPPYPGIAYPTQPQAAPAPYPQAAGYVYSPQPGYPAEQQPYPEPQQYPAHPVYPAQPGYPPQASYPAEQQQMEMQQYPADPAYPTQPYPTSGYPPPPNY